MFTFADVPNHSLNVDDPLMNTAIERTKDTHLDTYELDFHVLLCPRCRCSNAACSVSSYPRTDPVVIMLVTGMSTGAVLAADPECLVVLW